LEKGRRRGRMIQTIQRLSFLKTMIKIIMKMMIKIKMKMTR
jgi:hypothetical protein